MQNIQVTDEQMEILKRMSADMQTQDPRHIHLPLYCVSQEKKVFTLEGCGDELLFVDCVGTEITKDEFLAAWEDREQMIEEYGMDPAEYDSMRADNLPHDMLFSRICDILEWCEVEYKIERVLVDGQVYFTEAGAQAHIDLNKHHYHNPQVYTVGAWRNPELEVLMDVVAAIIDPNNKAHR